MDDSNRLRALSTDMMTLHPWQEAGEDEGTWRIFADVSFGTALVGADPAIPVSFRLSLKRVRINLMLPATDPALTFAPHSIARKPGGTGAIQKKATAEKVAENRSSVEAAGGVSSVWAAGKAWIQAKVGSSTANTTRLEEETTTDTFSIVVSGNQIDQRTASWLVEATHADRLSRSPWDAAEARAVVKDAAHKTRRDGMEAGGIVFEAVCAREDLIVEDLQLKDPGLTVTLLESFHQKAKKAALTQYIRSELERNGLHAENIDSEFGKLTILNHLIESIDVRKD